MPFDLGDPVPLAVNITDATGVPANAGTVTLTVTAPDGSNLSPSVTNGSTGSYSATYTPTQTGRYTVRWVATGANASAFTDVFEVDASASTNLLSLADAKAALNMTSTANDEELRWYIKATTDIIESLIGPVVVRTVTEELRARNVFVVSQTPMVALTGISGVLVGALQFDPTQLDVNTTSGVIRRIDRGIFGDDIYTITYTAGRPGPIAPRITQAAKVLLQHLWSTQRGASSAPAIGGPDVNTYAAGYSVPNAVLELLAHDLKAPGIA